MGPWHGLKRMSWRLAWIALIVLPGCCLLPNRDADETPFICEVQPAYDQAGKDDLTSYRVNRACLRGVVARLKAAYKE